MPFADEARAVARLLEERGKGWMARRQPDAFRRCGVDRLLEAHLEAHLIASGDQSSARWGAIGGIRIALRELEAFDRQTVHVRRRIVALTVAAHIRIAEIVREDEHDVRLGGLCKAGAAEAGQCQRACRGRLNETPT